MLEHADFADAETLLERLQNSDRGVVFLVGSALTAPRGGGEPGVPGVEGVIELIRARYRSRPESLARFEQALAADPSSRYQAAFRRLLDTHGQDAANTVIRQAVLAARVPGAVEPHIWAPVLGGDREACHELEADLSAWHLLPAVQALGGVITGSPQRFGQVVLTTNFDPLIEVSIRRAGGQVFLTVLHEDGSLEQTEAAGCRVVHLHGHWFRSDTLHTPLQLKQGRPKLHHSLARLLGERTLVVIGYGGWDDIFTRSLIDVIKGGLARFDVLWTFYRGDSRQIVEQHAKLLGDLESGIGRGRVRFYKGIDAHALFPALLAALAVDRAVSAPLAVQGGAHLSDASEGGGKVYVDALLPRFTATDPLESPVPPDVAFRRSTEDTFRSFLKMQSEPPPPGGAEDQRGGRPPSWPVPGPVSPGDRLQAAFDRLEELLMAGASNEAVAQVREEIRAIRRESREGRGLQPGDTLSSRYRLVERVGVGGFAVVWKAIDRKRLETVAVKILHSQHAYDRSRVERFYRGARTMERLNHQNIVRVIEPRAEDAGHHYFAMEFLAGGDFRQAVLAGTLSRQQIFRVIGDVGKALEYGHGQGIVHRDVKPQNILLGEDCSVRLTDFDLVHVADSTGGTRTGALGTFIYAPPEELTSGEADARGDIFSLGMSALFALYGRDLPWAALRDAAKFMAQIDCSDEVKTVLERAVRWERQERYPAMRAFCQALAEAAAAPEQARAAPEHAAEGQALPQPAQGGASGTSSATARTFVVSSDIPADRNDDADFVKKIITLQTVVKAVGDEIIARNNLADRLKHQGRYGESEALYRSTMQLAPGDLVARNGLALVLASQGRYGESEAVYRETVHRFPDDVVARNGVASVLAAQGRHGEAEAYYRATLQRFPDDVTAKKGLEEVLKAQGR